MELVQPLAGTVVVDLTHLLAGPFCTMLLADAGASVIKVEPPAGEISRHRLPRYRTPDGHEISAYFAAVNRGKSSVVLDLKTPVGARALRDLLGVADVIVMNYRESALQRLGIQPEQLRRSYPRAVVASITAFGRWPGGEEAQRPGLAIVAESVSGITALTQGDDGDPRWVGFALGDFVAGQAAFGAISAALVRSSRTGEGCYLDLSMTDSLLAFNAIDIIRAQANPTSSDYDRMSPVPYGVFPSASGHVVIGCNSDEFWVRLCQAMGIGDSDDARRFASAEERIRLRAEVLSLVSEWTQKQSTEVVLSRLVEVGVPCGPVNSANDVLDFEYLHRRGSLGPLRAADGVLTVPQASLGLGAPADGEIPKLPLLGEHTREILERYTGLSEAEVDEAAGRVRNPMEVNR